MFSVEVVLDDFAEHVNHREYMLFDLLSETGGFIVSLYFLAGLIMQNYNYFNAKAFLINLNLSFIPNIPKLAARKWFY